MSKQTLALTLVVLSLNLLCIAPAAAAPTPDADAKFTEKVKNGIAKLGTGPQALIEIGLRDKTKLKGYVREADESRVVVVDAKTGAGVTVLYPQISTVKGNNLSTGAKIAIGVGITIGVLLLLVALCSAIDSCAGS